MHFLQDYSIQCIAYKIYTRFLQEINDLDESYQDYISCENLARCWKILEDYLIILQNFDRIV